MSIFTICKLTDDSDVIVTRAGFFRYSIEIKRFSVIDGVIQPNGWPRTSPDFYGNLTWLHMRGLLLDLKEHEVAIPAHIMDYFDYHHLPGRALRLIKSIFN